MKIVLVLLLLLTSFGCTLGSEPPSPEEILSRANNSFTEGTKHKFDDRTAREFFRRAASDYDNLWRKGFHSQLLALQRARSHRLAGDMPRAIMAFHDGLEVAPFDRALKNGLEEARIAIALRLSSENTLQSRWQAKMHTNFANSISPLEVFMLATTGWLIGCLAVVRFIMTRGLIWLVFSLAIIFSLIGFVILVDIEPIDLRPLLVISNETNLRKGNAESYPTVLEGKLPPGVELHELGRRGGWVRVELVDGTTGWLPASCTICRDSYELDN